MSLSRSLLRSQPRQRTALDQGVPLATILFVFFLGLRIPFVSEYLVNWDAVNFALGIESFDLRHHQPHPPGYLGYILLGRNVGVLVGGGPQALSLVSVIAGSLAPAFLYLFGRRIVGERGGLISAVLIGSSPLAWYYSEVALTYALELALSIPIVLLCYAGRKEKNEAWLTIAAFLLACLGAVRQTSLVLLLPSLVYASLSLRWKARARLIAVTAACVLAWLVPLLLAVGGPGAYLELSGQLAEVTGGKTSIVSGNLFGMLRNLALIGVALVVGVGGAFVLLPIIPLKAGLDREARWILALWGIPALLVYVFIHTGQLGYILLLLPIPFLWLGKSLALRYPQHRLVQFVGAAALINTMIFLTGPKLTVQAILDLETSQAPISEIINELSEVSVSLSHATEEDITETLEGGARQIDLEKNDVHWEALLVFMENFEPNNTVVLANAGAAGSFRHLAYYLPEYRVYGLGIDRRGFYGHLFTAKRGHTDYNIDRLNHAHDRLILPHTIRYVVIPDMSVATRMQDQLDLVRVELGTGTTVHAAEIPGYTVIEFKGEKGIQHIEIDPLPRDHPDN